MLQSATVAEHPPLLKANCKYICGGLSSWTWNVACNLKVKVLSQQLVCYFGVWQLKVARKRSDFPVTPTICFTPMFTKVFAHCSAPKAVCCAEVITTPPYQQERAFFLSMPLPLPTPLLSILLSAACVTGQGAGLAQRARRGGRRRRLGQGRRFHPLLMVLRSASATAMKHVDSPKVWLFSGWLVHELLPHNIEKYFWRLGKCFWMIIDMKAYIRFLLREEVVTVFFSKQSPQIHP